MKISKKHYCKVADCPNLVEEGQTYCKNHQPRYERAAGKKFYNSKRWRELRKKVLREEPLCRECKKNGVLVPATEVDHIVPIAEGGTNERKNLQPLCKKCHSRKTMKEIMRRGGAGAISGR